MDDLENLLLENQRMINSDFDKKVVDKINHNKKNKLLTADGTMDLFQFIQNVEKIVTLAMKDYKVKFIPEENRIPIDNPDIKIDESFISYRIVDQEIKDKESLKPVVREDFIEDPKDPKSRSGQIYGQKFSSIIQFNIFSSVYAEAEQVMKKFEELLFIYAGPLKKKGLGEIFKLKQLTDTNLDQYRQTMSIRSIRYYVETENVFTVFREKFEEINILD